MRWMATAALLIAVAPALAGDAKLIRQLGESRLRHGQPISAIAFRPDGARLASAGGRLVRLFKPVGGKEVASLDLDNLSAEHIAFAPNGKTLAIAAGRRVIMWDLEKDQAIYWRVPTQDTSCSAVVFSPDGQQLAVAGTGVTLWDAATGKEVHFLKTKTAPGRALAFSLDGKLLAAGERLDNRDGGINLWNAASGELVRSIGGVVGPPAALAFIPGSEALASIGPDCGLQLWDVATGQQTRLLARPLQREPFRLPRLAVSADGQQFLSTALDGVVQQWNLATGVVAREFRGPPGGIGDLALSANGQWLAVGGVDGTLSLWGMATGIMWPNDGGHWGTGFGLGFAADGKTLYSACTGNQVITWDPVTGKRLASQTIDFRDSECVILGSPRYVLAIRTEKLGRATNPELRMVAQRWELADGKPVADGSHPHDGIFGVALAADGIGMECHTAGTHSSLAELLGGFPLEPAPPLTSVPGGLRGYIHEHLLPAQASRNYQQALLGGDASAAAKLQELRRTTRGITADWFVAAPDGRTWARLVAGTLQVYEAGTGAKLIELPHARPIQASGLTLRDRFAFSPQGRWLALARDDDEVLVCDYASGHELMRFRTGHEAVTALAFAPDGLVLATSGLDGAVRLWDVSALHTAPAPLTQAELTRCWDLLASQDAAAGRAAMWMLVDGAQMSLPFLREHLKAVHLPPTRRLERLLADLDAKEFGVREQASMEIEEYGPLAEKPLRQLLSSGPPLAVRVRVLAILNRLPARARLSAEERRACRAVAVLENVGNEAARQHLQELGSGDEQSVLTQEARNTLKRLKP